MTNIIDISNLTSPSAGKPIKLPGVPDISFAIPPERSEEDDQYIEKMLSIREWLRSALSDKGAEITGGGMGMGAADVDIKLDGQNYAVSIRPF